MHNKLLVIILLCPSLLFANLNYILLENDAFYNTDKHYTHGTKYLNIQDNCPTIFNNLYKNRTKQIGYSLAQHMYAPSDISKKELILNDRPYGGWLYFGVSLYVYSKDKTHMDFIEIDNGVTGSYSLSDKTQKLVHKTIGAQEPMGWKNQIKNEYGINAIYQKKYKYKHKYFELIPYYGCSIGNVFTYANIGTIFRTGYNIPNDFGLPRIEPTPKKPSNFGIYYFVDYFPRYVMRNIFLDGNTFKESHSIEKENWVQDIKQGISVSINNISFSYGYTYRSREFKNQEHHNEFGMIIFSWQY